MMNKCITAIFIIISTLTAQSQVIVFKAHDETDKQAKKTEKFLINAKIIIELDSLVLTGLIDENLELHFDQNFEYQGSNTNDEESLIVTIIKGRKCYVSLMPNFISPSHDQSVLITYDKTTFIRFSIDSKKAYYSTKRYLVFSEYMQHGNQRLYSTFSLPLLKCNDDFEDFKFGISAFLLKKYPH